MRFKRSYFTKALELNSSWYTASFVAKKSINFSTFGAFLPHHFWGSSATSLPKIRDVCTEDSNCLEYKSALPLVRLKRLQPPGYSQPAVETDSYSVIIMYPFLPVSQAANAPPDSSRLSSTPARAIQSAGRYDLSAFLNSVRPHMHMPLLKLTRTQKLTGHSRCDYWNWPATVVVMESVLIAIAYPAIAVDFNREVVVVSAGPVEGHLKTKNEIIFSFIFG